MLRYAAVSRLEVIFCVSSAKFLFKVMLFYFLGQNSTVFSVVCFLFCIYSSTGHFKKQGNTYLVRKSQGPYERPMSTDHASGHISAIWEKRKKNVFNLISSCGCTR